MDGSWSRPSAFTFSRWILPEGANACAIDGFNVGVEAGFHHGLRRMAMGHAHPLAKAVIQGVVQVKDHAAIAWPPDRGDLSFEFGFAWRTGHTMGSIVIRGAPVDACSERR